MHPIPIPRGPHQLPPPRPTPAIKGVPSSISSGCESDAQWATSQSWLTLAAAAAYLACNERTLRRRVKSGDIVAHRFGRQLRFRSADLDQALIASTAATANALDSFITTSIKLAPRAP